MKAALLRRRAPMGEYVNEFHPSPAYHSGRLIAVAVTAHASSLKRRAPECAHHYYLSASVVPAASFQRVLRELFFHLHRLEGRRVPVVPEYVRHYLRDQTDAILEEIHEGGGVPGPLSIEDRCRFALGYYQQTAALTAALAAHQSEAAFPA